MLKRILKMKKSAQRDANTARWLYSKVRTPAARPLPQTHRQDWLQYTAPQLARGVIIIASAMQSKQCLRNSWLAHT